MSLESTLYVHLVENSLIVHLRISPPPPEESSSQSSERPTSKPNRAWESRTFDIFKIIFFSSSFYWKRIMAKPVQRCVLARQQNLPENKSGFADSSIV